MSKSFRHGQILKLIRTQRINTQEELARSLKKCGISTTQVTLSRDVRELRLVKTQQGYQETPEGGSGPAFETLGNEFLLDVKSAQNLVVLRTSPGHANSVAVALDNEEWTDVVGTIAGDDTLLVIAPNNSTARRLEKRFLNLLKF